MNYETSRSNLYKELHPSILENPTFKEIVSLIFAGLVASALIISAVVIGH